MALVNLLFIYFIWSLALAVVLHLMLIFKHLTIVVLRHCVKLKIVLCSVLFSILCNHPPETSPIEVR